jgi:hypothetical protein
MVRVSGIVRLLIVVVGHFLLSAFLRLTYLDKVCSELIILVCKRPGSAEIHEGPVRAGAGEAGSSGYKCTSTCYCYKVSYAAARGKHSHMGELVNPRRSPRQPHLPASSELHVRTALACSLHHPRSFTLPRFPLRPSPPCSVLVGIKTSCPDALPARSHTNITSLKFVDVVSPSTRPLPRGSNIQQGSDIYGIYWLCELVSHSTLGTDEEQR